MRKLLGTLVIVVAVIAGFGFYRGWFSISKDDRPEETNVQLTIDKDKIRQDTDEAARLAGELGESVKSRVTEASE